MRSSRSVVAQVHKGRGRVALVRAAVMASASMAVMSPALAQDAQQADSEVQEAIIVTGTRLKGTEPVGSTVVTVDRETIVASGANTVADVVAQVPSLSGITLGEAAKNGNSGVNFTNITSANIRALGPDATLTLLEGRRLPLSGTTGNGVDLNNVPSIALERVEVLADGASAIYGSDAIAGVVNLVLRRNVEGLEVSGRVGFADNYTTHQAGMIFGHKWSRGQFTVAAELSGHDALRGTDRSFNRQDLTSFGGSDFSVTTCYPVNAVVNGVYYPVDAQGNYGAAGTPNKCEPDVQNDLLPSIKRFNTSANFDWELLDNLTLSFDGQFQRRDYDQQFAHVATTIRVGSNNPYFKLPAGVALSSLPLCATGSTDRCLSVDWFPNGVLGTRSYHGFEEVFSLHPNLTLALGGGWELTAGMTYGESTGKSYADSQDTTYTATAARSSDPAVALDPFTGQTSQATIDRIRNRVVFGNPLSKIENYATTVSGTLLTLPGGEVKTAISGEYRIENLNSRGFTGPYGSAILDNPYRRTIKAIAGELNVPVVGPDNAMAGIHSLTLSGALRYEKYSDFGSTTNPRVALNYEPVRGLVFKGGYSTSFHAPKPSQLVSRVNNTIVRLNASYIDANGVAQSGGTLQYNASNINLQPETSKNYSFGVELKPGLLGGFRASATYFNVDFKNKIAQYFNDPQILTDPNLAFLVTFNPTQAEIDAFMARGTAVNYNPTTQTPANVVALVDAQQQNLGSAQVDGIDFELGFDHDLADGSRLNVFANGTYLMHYKVQVTPGGPITDRINDYDYPTHFRGRGGIGWASTFGLRTMLYVNHVGSYRYDTPAVSQKVSSWTTFDLYAGYTFTDVGPLQNVTLGLNVQNLFDKDPPFLNRPAQQFNSGGYDGSKASPVGRMVAISLSTKL